MAEATASTPQWLAAVEAPLERILSDSDLFFVLHSIRCQREKAKIQAWINLECAKAEAQSRKLEVKPDSLPSSCKILFY
jgi:hypothetical protein